ncbi:MAG: phage tail protein [Alphaproteobacteria bacterium]|nr:phage tail protein [Alphaproteobacteria bacterium]
MTLQQDLEAAVAQVTADSNKLKDIVNGPADGEGSMVPTDSGDVKTVAKSLADMEGAYAANDVLGAATAARDGAETARDEAQTAQQGAAAALQALLDSIATQEEANEGTGDGLITAALLPAAIAALGGGGAKVGDLKWSDAQTTPEDHLLADGSLLLIADFPELFAAIGTQFGGDGVTDFRIRDARGVFPRFKDHGRGLDPDGDRPLGDEQADEFRSHTHSGGVRTGTGSLQGGGVYVDLFSDNTQATGGAETRPYNQVFELPYIKYR